MQGENLCDFCGIELVTPYWEFEVPDFVIVYWVEVDNKIQDFRSKFDGNWFACIVCHDLLLQILATRTPDYLPPQEDELAERGKRFQMSHLQDQSETHQEFVTAMVKETHAGFFMHYTGRKILHR